MLSETTGPSQIAALDVHSTRVDDLEAIHSGTYDGEVVTVEAPATETRLSTAETLVTALPCGSDAFYAGSTCVPALTDAVIHAGVLYDDSNPATDEMLLYTGISNTVQTTPVETTNQRLAVTGEVVPATEIDPTLEDERALVVYDVEPVDAGPSSPPVEVAAYRDTVEDRLQEQLVAAAADETADVQIVDVASPETHTGSVTIEVTLENQGEAAGDKEVRIQIGASDSPAFQETVTVNAQDSRSVTYTHDFPASTGAAVYVNDERYKFIEVADETGIEREAANESANETAAASTDDDATSAADDDASATATDAVGSTTTWPAFPGLLPAALGSVGLVFFLSAAVLDARRSYRTRNGRTQTVTDRQLSGLLIPAVLCAQLTAFTIGDDVGAFFGGLLGMLGGAFIVFGRSYLAVDDGSRVSLIAIAAGTAWAGLTLPAASLVHHDGATAISLLTIVAGGVMAISSIVVEALRQLKLRRQGEVTTDALDSVSTAAFGVVLGGSGVLVLTTSGFTILLVVVALTLVLGWFGTLFWLIYTLLRTM